MTDAANLETESVASVETPPDVDELVARAEALRPILREQQQASEDRGYYSEEVHRAFADAGFLRILVPRRYGGYELDVPAFYRVMIEVARGDPGSGWCLTLGASHALMVGSHFPEAAQREMFAEVDFVAPHTGIGAGGVAAPVDGGYTVSGRWEYASGIPYAGWFLGLGVLAAADGTPTDTRINVAVRRGDFEMLDNWGGDQVLGMSASGSHSVVVEDVFVPEAFLVPNDWHDPTDASAPTLGVALHGNPMYLGRARALYHTSIAAVQVGAAKACLDEFEELLRSRMTMVPPRMPRYLDVDSQRTHGQAVSMVDAAEALLHAVTARYMEYCHRWADTGEPFDIPKTLRLFGLSQQAGLLAANAVELMFRAAGTSAARRGSPMERYFRDTAMYQGHQSSQREAYWSRFSRVYLGLTQTVFESSTVL